MKQKTYPVAPLIIATIAIQACSEYRAAVDEVGKRIHQEAAAAVRAELESPEASNLELRTTAKPGNGLYVYTVDRSGNPEFVWLFMYSKGLYAIGKEELSLTPRVRLLKDASEDLRRDAWLTRVSRNEILHYLRSDAPGPYVSRDKED